jgi:alcohol dehydrogenase
MRPIRADEGLVRVAMSTICGSDLHSYHGRRPNPHPGILGHEITGVLAEVGPKMPPDLLGRPLRVGDRVTWTIYAAPPGSYEEDFLDLPQKAPGLRKYGHLAVADDPHLAGGFAEHCYLLPGTRVLRLPDELTDEEATPLNCGAATMVAVTEAAGIGLGDTVVIQGLGLLGIYGVALARSRGACTVIGLDGSAERRATAERFGADVTFDVGAMDAADLVAAVRARCTPAGADVVLEVCGVPAVVEQGLRMLRVGGRYVLAGLVSPGSTASFDLWDIVRTLADVRGVHNYHPRHLVQATDLVLAERDRYPFRDLVQARFGLDAIDDAFALAATQRLLRVAVVP